MEHFFARSKLNACAIYNETRRRRVRGCTGVGIREVELRLISDKGCNLRGSRFAEEYHSNLGCAFDFYSPSSSPLSSSTSGCGGSGVSSYKPNHCAARSASWNSSQVRFG